MVECNLPCLRTQRTASYHLSHTVLEQQGILRRLDGGQVLLPYHSLYPLESEQQDPSEYISINDRHDTMYWKLHNLRLLTWMNLQWIHILLGILKQRPTEPELKRHAIKIMNSTGSFDYCRAKVAEYENLARDEIRRLGGNARLERALDRLTIPIADDSVAEPSSHR